GVLLRPIRSIGERSGRNPPRLLMISYLRFGAQAQLGELPGRPAHADLGALGFGEPQVAVGAGRDPSSGHLILNREFRNVAIRSDPPEPVDTPLGKPQVPVRPSRYARWIAVRCRDQELRDDPRRSDPPDPGEVIDREPQVAVGPRGDGHRN